MKTNHHMKTIKLNMLALILATAFGSALVSCNMQPPGQQMPRKLKKRSSR